MRFALSIFLDIVEKVVTPFFHILFLAILVFQPSFSHARNTEELRLEEKHKVEIDIQKQQINIERLKRGMVAQQEGIEHSLLKEKGVLAELEDIDMRLIKTAERLQKLQERMDEQNQLIDKQKKEIEEVKTKLDKVQAHLEKRMIAYYKLGKIDLINIAFSTQTLPELLKFHDSFQTVIKYDQTVFAQYRETLKKLVSSKETLTLELGLLEEFIYQANEEKRIIKETREQKEGLLERIRTQTELHKLAIKEIEEAKEELSGSLLALQKKEELFDQGFLLNKSKHIPPMQGTVTSLFNQKRVNEFGIERTTPGITLTAMDGTQIHSIYDGAVIYAGYLKGYGNTVIIDHGYQYYTITSRIERILVTKGSNVKRDDSIGVMGTTATVVDSGLYFEIRLRDKPLDPLQWVDNDLLKFAGGLRP